RLKVNLAAGHCHEMRSFPHFPASCRERMLNLTAEGLVDEYRSGLLVARDGRGRGPDQRRGSAAAGAPQVEPLAIRRHTYLPRGSFEIAFLPRGPFCRLLICVKASNDCGCLGWPARQVCT